ncbi:MAG: hypothetical protein ACLSHC_15460 [Bilophila wadsworthia]
MSNPGIVTNYLPVYWNIYNAADPSMTRKAQEEETAPAANSRPAAAGLGCRTPNPKCPTKSSILTKTSWVWRLKSEETGRGGETFLESSPPPHPFSSKIYVYRPVRSVP